MRTHKLFVYGTLKKYPPFVNFIKNGDVSPAGHGEIKAKRVKFKYPAAVEDKKEKIRGEIFLIKNPEKVLPILDEYEEFYPDNPSKSLYIKKIKKAKTDAGKYTYVLIYMLNEKCVTRSST